MILVTGSLGYIGSVLTQYLKEKGRDVKGMDTGFFKDCTLYNPEASETIFRDVRDFKKDDLRGVDTLVHLAGISNDPFGNINPEKIYDPTREYTKRIAALCKENGTNFIFASSCSVYGKASEQVLTEDSQTNPQTPYSVNKLQIEGDLKELADKDFSPIILRFATAFGLSPRIRFDVFINMFVGMAVSSKQITLNSDGMAWRPNVHVLDICKAIESCSKLDYDSDALILNVGDTQENYQIIDIAKMVRDSVSGCVINFLGNSGNYTNEEELIRDRKVPTGVDTRTYKVSFEKIKQVIPGFTCDWPVLKGIKSIAGRLEELSLTKEQFSCEKYYRLQTIEKLHEEGKINDDLFWMGGESNG